MTRSFFAAAALILVAAAALECKRANGAYCDELRPCPSGFACEPMAHECHTAIVGGGGDMAGGSTDMAGCTCSGATPICVAMTCVSCLSSSDPEGACAAADPSTPHCLTTDPGSGACVGCRDASDCSGSTPFCDATAHVCRGCLADAECPSLICDLTPGASSPHSCIPATQVIYADPAGDDAKMGLTPAMPTKTIQHAINVAVGLNPARPYVRAAAGTYPDFFGVNNKTIYVVGANGTFVHVTQGGKDAVGASGGGSLTLRNMTVEADAGNGGNCSSSSLAAYQVKFINSSQVGIQSTSCAPLILDGCTVSGNVQGGVFATGDFTIVNTVIAKNTGTGMYQTTSGANTIFVNNTVADNSTGGGEAGVHCALAGSFAPVNTILYNNKTAGATISETNCSGSFLAIDEVSVVNPTPTVNLIAQPPGFVGGGDYHLAPGSPCVDKGTSTLGAPNHDADFKPRPDGTTMLFDIGAYELQ